MRFYKEQHQFYTGIDLHARTMYVCVMDNTGSIVYHKNMPSTPEALQHVISLYGKLLFQYFILLYTAIN